MTLQNENMWLLKETFLNTKISKMFADYTLLFVGTDYTADSKSDRTFNRITETNGHNIPISFIPNLFLFLDITKWRCIRVVSVCVLFF